MKKSILSMCAGLVLVFALSSCGEKLLTEAEVSSMIDTQYNEAATAIAEEMDANCTETFDARVEAEVARMTTEAEAAETVQ